MILYKIKDPITFKTYMTSIAPVVTNIVIMFGKQLRIYGIDESGICMFDSIIGKEEFDIIKDGIIKLIINTNDFLNILKRFNNPEELAIGYNGNAIIIKGKMNKKTKTFKLSIIDEYMPPDPAKKLANLELNSIFNIPTPEMVDLIGDGGVYGEAFIISTSGKFVNIKGISVVGEFEDIYELNEEVLSEEIATYSVEIISTILSKIKSPLLTISFAEDFPMSIYVKLSPHSYINWFIAPRVEPEWEEEDEF